MQQFSRQIVAAQDEIAETERAVKSCDVALGELELKHSDECVAEAQGQKSNRAKVESDVSAMYARKKGLSRILDDKRGALQRLRNDASPLEKELAELYRQENVDAKLQEIAESEQAGETEIQTYRATAASFHRRLADLRGFTDPVLETAGKHAAERLELAWMGRQ